MSEPVGIKTIAGLLALALTGYIFIPYVLSIWHNRIKPHAFSWIIWGVTTLIVFFAQWQAKAGWGAIPIGFSAVLTLTVAGLAFYKKTDTDITPTDWIFFLGALSSMPVWWLTNDPTWSVLVLTIVDLLGFGPTIRKSYEKPHEESALFFTWFAIRNALVLLALESYSVATSVFPAVIGLACVLVVILIMLRRQSLRKNTRY